MRTSRQWLVTLVGAMGLAGCSLNGAPPNASSTYVGTGGRWSSNPVAWKAENVGRSSYVDMAFGPGQATPIARETLLNPSPNGEYLPPIVPAVQSPMVGEALPSEDWAKIAPPIAPSDDYYVNGQNLGQTVDRAQAGIPVQAPPAAAQPATK